VNDGAIGGRANALRLPIDVGTPTVVLKFDQNPMHHGGLGVIRSLGRVGVPVYGVHEGPRAPAASSRYLTGRFFWQPEPEDADRVLAGLRRLSDLIGEPAVLLPTDDAGAIFLSEHGDSLRALFRFPALPDGLPRRLAGKYSLYELCTQDGILCPKTALPASLAQAREFAAGSQYPLVAKLTAPWSSGGLRSTTIVRDADQLDEVYRACDEAGAGLMLQEFIPSAADSDWFFHGYCDATSTCKPAFTGVKERSYPAHAGLTSLGRATPNERLREQVTTMLTKLGYRGILDLDLRWDSRDDQYKLLDFNPRLGAQFRLFRNSANIDVALAYYLDLTGQVIPGAEQEVERRFLVENYDPIAAIGYWRRGELDLRTWLRSVHGVEEKAWFARDDLRPFGLMCLRMGWRAATRALPVRRERPASTDPRYSGGRTARGPPRNVGCAMASAEKYG